MEEIRKQEFNKTVEGQRFIITLEYGMKEDKSNHILKLSITHILDETTGKKAKIIQDDITDLLHIPNVYKESDVDLSIAMENIKSTINSQIEMVINSGKNQESTVQLIDKLFEDGI